MASNIMECSNCNKREDPENKLKNCAVCGAAKYCSALCQKADWASHKATCTRTGCLQLIAAIQENDSKTVARLAKTKRVLNGKVDYTPPPTKEFPDPYEMGKWTALHECVRKEKMEMMKLLVDSGANLEMQDVDGETPVFVASTSQNPELIKVLLNAGANPNAQGEDGWSSLMMAARGGDYGTTKALLEAGADLNHGWDMLGRTALDVSSQQASGKMGVFMSDGESREEALMKHRKVEILLSEWATRNR